MNKFSPRKLLNYLINRSSKRFKVLLYLMDRFDWDFCMLVFSGTDAIQHALWQYHKKKILQYYKKLDAFIEELISKSGSDTNVILMSDHGFGPIYKFFHVNYFLHRLGLLTLKREPARSGRYLNIRGQRYPQTFKHRILLKTGITKETIYNLAKKLRMIAILQKLPKFAKVKLPTTQKSIDWNQTRVFFNSTVGSSASISINLKGREPEGIVEKEEYAELRDFVISELLKVEDPETGRKLVQDA